MPNINQYYQSESDYLKASDLKAGQKFKLTITGNCITEFNDNKDKISLEFAQTGKRLVLNKTNATTIAHVHGDEADAWNGKDIFIFSTKVSYGDKMVDAIRVEMPLVEGTIQEDVSIRENTPAEDFQAPQAGKVGALRSKDQTSDYDDDIPF